MKRGCVREYGIPARMFNAVRVSLEGKVSGARESQLLHAETLKGLVRRAGRELASARKRGDSRTGPPEDAQAGQPSVTGWRGSRPIWRRAWSGCASAAGSCGGLSAIWRPTGTAAMRSGWPIGGLPADGEFFVLGSRDESGGCQLCVAGVAGDGSLTLRLRMPDCLAGEHGKYLVIEGVKFAYGHGQVLAVLQANLEFAECRRRNTAIRRPARPLWDRQYRTASSGMRRDGGCSSRLNLAPMPAVTDRRLGAIGVDLNADHLAVTETDSSGNWLRSWRVPLVTYGRSSHQAEALTGDAVAGVIEYARSGGQARRD